MAWAAPRWGRWRENPLAAIRDMSEFVAHIGVFFADGLGGQAGTAFPFRQPYTFFEQSPENVRRFRRMSTELDMADFSRLSDPPGGHFGLISMARSRSDTKLVMRT
jgi:hypothetical protein